MTSHCVDIPAPGPRAGVVLSSIASDSHTWNLVYLQLLLEELGYRVDNLGSCVPEALLLDECLDRRPELVVISSVNGHGYTEGLRVASLLRARRELAETALVIGGKLGTDGTPCAVSRKLLLEAGFDRVFDDGNIAEFQSYLDTFADLVSQ
jgi:methylaspartate mutase sigma subunit